MPDTPQIAPADAMDFSRTRALFALPDGVTYLDGNSLGPLPRAALSRVDRAMRQEWGDRLISAWNTAGWMDQPARLGDRIGRLIGAEDGSVIVGDTLSIKLFQTLDAALSLRPERRIILTDSGNFPSDLYMAAGLARLLNRGVEVRTVPPADLPAALDRDVAVLMLTQVDYRTGRRHDMADLTRRAHAAGALALWDLAHSAGAIPVDLTGTRADFAVGCTYKYLNAGPGAPAFLYARPGLADEVTPALSGWLGHADPFAFDPDYRPAPGRERFRIGTPPVLQMAALEAALDIWDQVSIPELHSRSRALSQMFIDGVEAGCPDLTLASPRDGHKRGSQVSFRHPHGYAVMQALISRGVIGDFRAPDILRFGITPLYIGEGDIQTAIDTLRHVLSERLWDRPAYNKRQAVT